MLAETLSDWLRDLEKADYARTTVVRYAGVVRRFLAWYEQQERRTPELTDMTPIALVGYRSALQRNWSTSTVNVHVVALRAWCQWLTERGYLEENPAARLKSLGQVKQDAPEPLSNNAVNALLRAARRSRNGKRDYAILQMLIQTGMRLGECQALCWGDIALGTRKGTVLIRAGKGNKARTIPLNRSVPTALVEYAAPLLACEANAAEVVAS